MTGAADALLGPSTLHLFWDACTILAREPRVVFAADRGSYAVARWGLERAAAQGAEVALSYANIRAPVSGRVIDRLATSGVRPVNVEMAQQVALRIAMAAAGKAP